MYQLRLSNEQLPLVDGCGLLATAEGFIHADRNLPFHVLIYVLEGTISVTEDGTDYAIGPGELLFLKSGIRHYGRQLIPRGTRWYYVHFGLSQPVNDCCKNVTACCKEKGKWLVLPKTLSHLAGSSVEKELAALVELSRHQDESSRWYLNQQLFVLLSHIAQYAHPKPTASGLADRIAAFLAAHKQQPFMARELEKTFFLSYKHMAAVFKQSRGTTMQAYHQRLRMEEGARMLRETLLPVGEISERLGFSDQLYFSRCFHRFAGVSPSDYRRRIIDY